MPFRLHVHHCSIANFGGTSHIKGGLVFWGSLRIFLILPTILTDDRQRSTEFETVGSPECVHMNTMAVFCYMSAYRDIVF